MSRKPQTKSCVVDRCRSGAIIGLRVCTEHAHPLKLQAEIERLNSTRNGRWQDLLHAVPGLRESAEKLQTLRFRAQVGKSSSVAQMGRFSGFSDGTVEYGQTVVLGSSAASVKQDEGRWGAAVALVRQLDEDLARLLDPHSPKPKDTRVTCGESGCPGRWRKQPFESNFCRYCGRGMRELEEAG
jgi:hypothetical protein